MEPLHVALLEKKELDQEMARAEEALRAFDPQLSEIETPLTNLEKELESTRTRLAELRLQAVKLEKAAEAKRDRLRSYEARMEKVRNEREQTAVRLEMDLVRKAADADDEEAVDVMDQVTRTDLRQEELDKQLTKMREEAAPKREAVLQERSAAESALAVLRDRRENLATRLDPSSRRLYDQV